MNHIQTPGAHSEANGETLPKDTEAHTRDLDGGIPGRIWQREKAAPIDLIGLGRAVLVLMVTKRRGNGR